MSNARRTLTALVVGASILAACGGDGATPTTTTAAPTTTAASATTTETPGTTAATGERIRFGSGQYPFSLYYPADWTGDTSQEETVIVITAPTTGTDEFPENVNVLATDEAGGFDTLIAYVEANYETLESVIPEFEHYDEFEAELGGEPAYVLVYGGVFDGAEIDFFQVFAIHEGLAYIITYTGAGEDFDTYLDVMLDLLDSWEWRD